MRDWTSTVLVKKKEKTKSNRFQNNLPFLPGQQIIVQSRFQMPFTNAGTAENNRLRMTVKMMPVMLLELLRELLL